jgi:hypothetical protein
LTLPSISDLTGVNATEPRTSTTPPISYHPNYTLSSLRKYTKQRSQRLRSLKELSRSDGIVLLLIDWYISEGFLEGVEEGSSVWVCLCCHCICGTNWVLLEVGGQVVLTVRASGVRNVGQVSGGGPGTWHVMRSAHFGVFCGTFPFLLIHVQRDVFCLLRHHQVYRWKQSKSIAKYR